MDYVNKKEIELFPRDLSWLSFNKRVLMEAERRDLPVFERLKFLAIYSSNLDEFFRVRVASLKSLEQIESKKVKKALLDSPQHILIDIYKEVDSQQEYFGEIYRNQVIPDLESNGIRIWQDDYLDAESLKDIRHYFKSQVLAYIKPVEIKDGNGLFLNNRSLYFFVLLDLDGSDRYFMVNIPSEHLPRFFKVKTLRDDIFLFLDDVVRLNMSDIFRGALIKGVYSVKLNRDADLQIDDEFSGDLVKKIQDNLKNRNIGIPSRLLYDASMPDNVLGKLKSALKLNDEEFIRGARYHNFYDFFSLPNPKNKELERSGWSPLDHRLIDRSDWILDLAEEQDLFLHFPYQSYDYILQLFNEAAIDPYTEEIRVTLYRIAKNSAIANALISAAKNGKKVIVFVELKARFDEENNILWSKKMEEAGIKIIYSLPGLKVHAKVALFTRVKEDIKSRIAFYGTGNFNEKTADVYADHALITSHRELNKELDSLLKYLHKKKPNPTPKSLLVSQFNMKDRFKELIKREVKFQNESGNGKIILKLNNLEDPAMIKELYEACDRGVDITIIIRGICCIIPKESDSGGSIKLIRIVDRYLEHARIFYFYNGGNEEILMGSADWMKRNLNRRIEVVVPIYDAEFRNDLLHLLALQIGDKAQGVIINEKLDNILLDNSGDQYGSQEKFYKYLAAKELQPNGKESTLITE